MVNNKERISKRVIFIILLLISIITIYPFLWTFFSSFKTTDQLYGGNPLFLRPNPWTIKNYINAFRYVPLLRFILNTLMVSVVVTTLQVLIGSMAGYAFARINFKGKNIVFFLFLSTMMVPGHITLIPNYALLRYFGWLNEYKALMIPPVFTGLCAIGMFLMRQYFMSIPRELEEAALIDGCSRHYTFWKIIMPNSKPAIATFVIINFKAQWNSFLWPLIMMSDVKKMTMQVGLSYFKGVVSTDWATLLAGTTISILPVIIIFLVFQQYFIEGVMTSGLGGK